MRKNPNLLELNAFFYVSRMSEKYGRKLTLTTIPVEEWRIFAEQGFSYIWLMGVWRRSPGARAHALGEPNLRHAYDLILPGWTDKDVAGSPYAIYGYELDPFLGDPAELAQLKARLNNMGMGLLVDFVPNHLAYDHPWTAQYPERFVSCKPQTLKTHPDWFFTTSKGAKLAHGRDPFFPAWIDTVQVNFWSEELRRVWLKTLLKIAKVADGVRCDMAMLGLNEIFQQVWGDHITTGRPSTEFWYETISRVKRDFPDFVFMGEVYWGLDWRLQQLGFDFTYDKKMYDRLFFDSAVSVHDHLKATMDFQEKSVRFIENHDEERAPVRFGRKKSQAAGIVTATVPGLRFFNDGQLEGRRIRTPIHLRREPKESVNAEIAGFYKKLLKFSNNAVIHNGDWMLLEPQAAWEANGSYQGILAWFWRMGEKRKLIVVNYSTIRAQCAIFLPPELTANALIQFCDVLADKVHERSGKELAQKGLYVNLPAWHAHLFDLVI